MMRRFLLTIVLSLLLVVPGLAQGTTAQVVPDPDQLAYLCAVLDAQANLAHAKYPPFNPAVWDISSANPALVWQGKPGESAVLMAAFAPSVYYPTTGQEIPAGTDLWVTPVPEMKTEIMSGIAGDYKANPALAVSKYLGLPPVNSNNAVVEFWVAPVSMLRPAISTDITDQSAETEFPLTLQVIPTVTTAQVPKTSPGPGYAPASDYVTWFLERESSIYALSGSPYPWTGLGYTYNWANPADPVGGSEFLIPKGTPVTVKSVTPIGQYFR